jgi:hypothetical protein
MRLAFCEAREFNGGPGVLLAYAWHTSYYIHAGNVFIISFIKQHFRTVLLTDRNTWDTLKFLVLNHDFRLL